MSINERLGFLEKTFSEFRVLSGPGVTVEGNIGYGLAINSEDGVAAVEFIPPTLGCTDPTAENYEPDATEDDGSCEYLGACCGPAETPYCDNVAEENCFPEFGETWLSGKRCEDDPCPPPFELACDFIEGYAEKCGFRVDGEEPEDTKYYLERTQNYSFHFHSPPLNHVDCTYESTATYSREDDCEESTCEGSAVQVAYTDGAHDGTMPFWFEQTITGTQNSDCTWHNVEVVNEQSGTTTTDPYSTTPECGNNNPITTYDDEYTTAETITKAEDDADSYDDDFDDSCEAYRFLDDDESNYSFGAVRYKFVLGAPSPNDFVINWDEHTYFDDSSESSTSKFTTVLEGETESAVFTVDDLPANGYTVIDEITASPL